VEIGNKYAVFGLCAVEVIKIASALPDSASAWTARWNSAALECTGNK